MAFIVLAAIAAVVIFIAAGFKTIGGKKGWKPNPKQWLTFAALLFVAPAFFAIVPANTVGVVYSPFSGGVQEETLSEGINMKGPLDTVTLISTEVQSITLSNLYGQTEDSQYLTISVDVKYYVQKAAAVNVFKKFRTLDKVTADLVNTAAQRAIETATTNYNIMEILGDQRTQVYMEIESTLSERFEKDGISLHSITFLDTDGGEEIEQAIRNEAVAKKAVETAEQERTKAEIQALTRIIQAEAEAKEKEILAAAISQNPEILELEWIKKWNGDLPTYLGGDTGNVMIDLGGLQDDTAHPASAE